MLDAQCRPMFESSYLVNAILSHYLTAGFYSFHMVGRVTEQNAVILSTNQYVWQYALPSQKYENALKNLI